MEFFSGSFQSGDVCGLVKNAMIIAIALKDKILTWICPPFERSNQNKWKNVYNFKKDCCWTGVQTHVQKFWCLEGLLKCFRLLITTHRKQKMIELMVVHCWSPFGAARNWLGIGQKFSRISRPRLGRVALDLLGVSGRWCCARCCRQDLSTVVVLLVGGRRSNGSDGDCCCCRSHRQPCCGCCCCDVVLGRCRLWCCEDLLPQSWSLSPLKGRLVVVVAVIRLGRLRLGCLVVVVVGLRSPS